MPSVSRPLIILAAVVGGLSMSTAAILSRAERQGPARYLFAWAGDDDRADSDFLAVVDLREEGDRYGTVVATAPVGEKALWPHHTEHELWSGAELFANGFPASRNFVFDLGRPLAPTVKARFGGAGELSFLHSFVRLPNGHVLATFQGKGPGNVSPGGIAELDQSGRLVRSASVADAEADQTSLRPYSLAVVPSLDRIVIGLHVMGIPAWHSARSTIAHDHRGNQVQVRRLTDLSLIKTIRLPENDGPNEPRVLRDGRTVLVTSVSCRLYRVAGLDGVAPALERVFEASAPGCAMPVVVGDYWVQAHASEHRVYALDIRDAAHVREVSSVAFDERQRPHWLATDGRRIVMVNEPVAEADRRLWMLQMNLDTGQLALDTRFRDSGASRPGVSFERQQWPHGATGGAVPHGTVFGW